MRPLVALLAASLLLTACGGAGAPGPSASPTAIAPIPGAVLVTRANDQGTVQARVGDRIQIALGTDFEWRLDPPHGVRLTPGVGDRLPRPRTQPVRTPPAPGPPTNTPH